MRGVATFCRRAALVLFAPAAVADLLGYRDAAYPFFHYSAFFFYMAWWLRSQVIPWLDARDVQRLFR